ncbi:hypothetical protein BT93_C1315 [Corymbia citriodora subsp. variegata]|nr:hypothetical protein BT93_C1315 [Corymbia citriodora subsp. variegata]
MAMKIEVVSTETIKPSSPTPSHLKNFKLCLLDQLAPPKLENFALTGTLPLGGRVKVNTAIDCNDEGALYLEAKAHFELSEVLLKPDINQLQQFHPFSPCRVALNNEEPVIVGIQANFFDCGGIGIGICISHKIADGASASAFLTAWSEIALNGINCKASRITPFLKASELFPPKDVNFQMPRRFTSREKLSTKRFRFDGESLARLRARKRPEWKEKSPPSSAATQTVNIRSRMRPQPLPENALGNLWQTTVAPLMDAHKGLELQDLAGILRKSMTAIDGEYLSVLQGEKGLAKAYESLVAARKLAESSPGKMELYGFSSWVNFPFYEVDFGLARPAWACTTGYPIENMVFLMGTRCGKRIKAWITLRKHDMIEFEHNDEVLQFVSLSP